MRRRRAVVIVVACALATGCGSGARPGTVATSAAPGTPSGSVRSAAAQCSGPVRLGTGVSVAAWRLGAIRFVSATSGVGLTAPQVPCARSLGPGQGTEVSFRPEPVRLAVTDDGGRQWVTRGGTLPGTPQSPVLDQVAAVSGADVWVVSDTGVLLATRDYGASWAAQPLPVPVMAAASAGGWLWAASCPAVSGNLCRPVVERMRLPGGTWTRAPLPAPAQVVGVQLAVLSGYAAVVVMTGPQPALLDTTDGGAHWSARTAPDGPPFRCGFGLAGSFTAAGLDDWWLLCPGGAAAGSSTKALWRSRDAGRTWTLVSAITSLGGPRQAGALPYQDGAVIAAAAPDRLWIVTPNTMSVSTDGGAFWSMILVNAQGAIGQFDVLSGTVAWLLGPGTGLWQTTNGITWHPIGGTGPLARARLAGIAVNWPTDPPLRALIRSASKRPESPYDRNAW